MVFSILITAAAIIAFIFLAVNILRLIIVALAKPKTTSDMGADLFENKIDGSIQFAKFYYIYITAFSLIIIAVGVIGLLEILNINLGLTPFKITGF
jgi:hypothetical protein